MKFNFKSFIDRLAKLRRLGCFEKGVVTSPSQPIVNVTVNNGIPLVPVTATTQQKGVDPSVEDKTSLGKLLSEFEDSFSNAAFGSSNRAPSTIKKIVDGAKQVVEMCGYKEVADLYTKEGFDALRVPFNRNVTFSTKKGICQAFTEFIEFLEFHDLDVPERRRVLLLSFLKKAYNSFSRGVAIDNANRRVKLSDAIRNNLLPTFADVCQVLVHLANQVNHLFTFKQVAVNAIYSGEIFRC